MIPIFRKTRKKMADDNKPLKYMRYAIGEILLVVIGILIALQINNLNELRKDRDKEQVLLRQLNREYKSNLIQLDQKIEIRELIIKSAFRLLAMRDDSSLIVPDSIVYYLSNSRMSPTFDPIKNDLINGGKLDLIKDEGLKSMLTAWGSNEEQLEEAELKWLNILDQFFKPMVFQHDVVRELVAMNYKGGSWNLMSISSNNGGGMNMGESKNTERFIALLKDDKFESFLSWAIGVNTYNNLESDTLRNHIEAILISLDERMKPIKE